jgi:hypothetical protein
LWNCSKCSGALAWTAACAPDAVKMFIAQGLDGCHESWDGQGVIAVIFLLWVRPYLNAGAARELTGKSGGDSIGRQLCGAARHFFPQERGRFGILLGSRSGAERGPPGWMEREHIPRRSINIDGGILPGRHLIESEAAKPQGANRIEQTGRTGCRSGSQKRREGYR